MATVQQENIGTLHDKIKVSLTTSDYMPTVEKALKAYSKNASIPGFRKGMVPSGMIKKMYGQSIFADEVLKLAGLKLEEHLIENKAEIFARPLPTSAQEAFQFDINSPKDFEFEFEIGTKPNFDIPLLSNKSKVNTYKVIVSHEMLEEEIDKLLYKAGEMQDKEIISSEDNVINITFEQCSPDGELIENGIKKDNSLLLKYFNKSAQNDLINKRVGDRYLLQLNSAFDDKILPAIIKDLDLNIENEASKTEWFNMTISKIGFIEKAELNEETFEKIYPGREIKTQEEFKEVLSQEIQRYWDDQARIKLHNELFEKLVHETPITLPTQFLKRWMSEGGESYKSPEQVEKEFGTFEHQLRWQLVSDKIIQDNNLHVDNSELEDAARAQIMSYFGQYGSMPSMDADWMEPFVKKQLADKKFTDELYNRIITDKLFYMIENSVTLNEVSVSLQEFIQLPSTHHHHH